MLSPALEQASSIGNRVNLLKRILKSIRKTLRQVDASESLVVVIIFGGLFPMELFCTLLVFKSSRRLIII